MERETLEVLIKKSQPYLKRWAKSMQGDKRKLVEKVVEAFGWDITAHFFLSQCEYENMLDMVQRKLLSTNKHKKFSRDEIHRLKKVFFGAVIIANAQIALSPEERRLYAFVETQLTAAIEEIFNDAMEEFPEMSESTVQKVISKVMETFLKSSAED